MSPCIRSLLGDRESFFRDFVIISFVYLIIRVTIALSFLYIPIFRIDITDISVYYTWMSNIIHGLTPYQDFNVNYPPIFWFPIIISAVLSGWLVDPIAFMHTFMVEMLMMDFVTTLCIYLIVKKIYGYPYAVVAPVIYCTSVSSVFFVIYKFDAFPIMFMMLAMTAAVYGREKFSYAFSALGFFTKMFPIIVFPFAYLHMNNGERFSFKRLIKLITLWVVLPLAILLTIFPKIVSTFIDGASSRGELVYPPTLWYAIASLGNITLNPHITSILLLIFFAILTIGLFLYFAMHAEEKSIFIAVVCIAIFFVTLSSTHWSTQFSMWITPLLAILLCRKLYGIILFLEYQIINFVTYPVLWEVIYTNSQYLSPFAKYYFIGYWAFSIFVVWYATRSYISGVFPSLKSGIKNILKMG